MARRRDMTTGSSVERFMDRTPATRVAAAAPLLRHSFTTDDPVLVAIRKVREDLERQESRQAQRDAAYRVTLREIVLRRSR